MRATRSLPGRTVGSRLIVVATLTVALLAACGGDSVPVDSPTLDTADTGSPRPQITPSDAVTQLDLPVTVAVTLPLFEEFVREAAGAAVEVFSIVPEGIGVTSYAATNEDIELFGGVFFFYVNGLGLDDHLAEQIELYRDERAFVIPFSPNIRSPEVSGETAEAAGDEAHLWLDPILASVYVEIVADEFIIYDAVTRSLYDEAFGGFRSRMLELTQEVAEALSVISAERRKIVSDTDDFTHFARRFELEVLTTADAQDGDRDTGVQELAAIVRDEGAAAVFARRGYDATLMEAVAQETSVPLCLLYTDILDDAVSGYEDMIRANAVELVRCLAE